MITLFKILGEWHVITVMDGAMMCRANGDDVDPLTWDSLAGPIEDEKQIPELDESVCPKCVKACFEADKRTAEYNAQLQARKDEPDDGTPF